MKTLEDILDKLAETKHVLVILKANEGYSAVPMTGELYSEAILMEKHFNAHDVLAAAHKALEEVPG